MSMDVDTIDDCRINVDKSCEMLVLKIVQSYMRHTYSRIFDCNLQRFDNGINQDILGAHVLLVNLRLRHEGRISSQLPQALGLSQENIWCTIQVSEAESATFPSLPRLGESAEHDKKDWC